MSNSLRIGLAQFQVHWENPEKNMNQVQDLLQFDSDMDLLVLPEMWSTGFTMHPEEVAENEKGPALSWMKEYAEMHNIAIAGSISTRDNGKYFNRLYFVQPDGTIAHYDKRHLFSYGDESEHYSAGSQRLIIDYKGWRILPVICYDLRFPVWCRNRNDYDILMIVANWPVTRIHHWDTLLKARAIENQAYVVAVNRIGSDEPGLHYPGHSTVIDMNGIAILEMKDKEGIGIAQTEKEELLNYRDHFRFLQDSDDFNIL